MLGVAHHHHHHILSTINAVPVPAYGDPCPPHLWLSILAVIIAIHRHMIMMIPSFLGNFSSLSSFIP